MKMINENNSATGATSDEFDFAAYFKNDAAMTAKIAADQKMIEAIRNHKAGEVLSFE